ncbi:calpain small subunit 1-like [Eucalyptus grandis]|uniref:calpain small subunit 1-like n=1 Tax=Eucalyptus grandis TaxID=71139 RepID=UPI00192EFB55|nr:calpain small subunit 1-like [Eucalyptus grandis]
MTSSSEDAIGRRSEVAERPMRAQNLCSISALETIGGGGLGPAATGGALGRGDVPEADGGEAFGGGGAGAGDGGGSGRGGMRGEETEEVSIRAEPSQPREPPSPFSGGSLTGRVSISGWYALATSADDVELTNH